MWRSKARSVPGGAKAFVYAVAVHVTLLLLLGISLRFSTRPSEPPRVVQARVMDETSKPAPEPPDTARLDAQRRKEAETQAEAERARQAEVKKQQDAERRQQKDTERKKQAAETERAEKKKAAALEKKQAEDKRRKEAESALQEQVADEEKRRADARAQGEVERYKALIRQKVSRSWNRPATAAKGLQCTVRVRLVAGGEVLAASVVRSSGDPVFDRSVENAVHKATPLPVPQDPKLFDYFREIEFVFSPEN